MPAPSNGFRIRVASSTSNLGPGFDCLGLALPIELQLEVTPLPAGSPQPPIELSGTLTERPIDGVERIGAAMGRLASHWGAALPAARVRAHSEIPVARGMGSSGSATVAGLLAAAAMLRADVPEAELFQLGCELEGHPDNIGPALLGGCVIAMPERAGKVHYYQARLHPDLRIVVAWPRTRVETKRARAVLPTSVPFSVARDQARRLAQLLRGLEDLDPARLALALDDELHTPYRAPLIPGCAEVLRAARDAGALGAAISGSGSAMIALGRGDLERVGVAMAEAFTRAGETPQYRICDIPRAGARVEPLSGSAAPT